MKMQRLKPQSGGKKAKEASNTIVQGVEMYLRKQYNMKNKQKEYEKEKIRIVQPCNPS